MTKKTLLERMKLLLPETPAETLDFACELTLEAIRNYCNLPEAPDGLLNTAAMMARGLVCSTKWDGSAAQPEVKSVSRGDTSFTFASAAEQMAQLAAGSSFLMDYRTQLNAYRKMR